MTMAPGYFFIGGPPKSGTTWVQRTLDLHPEIVCSGEGHMHEYVARPMAQMFDAYNRKLAVVGDVVYEGQPYCPPVTREDQFQMIRAVMTILMDRRSKPGARMIGDKTPANGKVLDDLHRFFPELKFISVQRDPRDVAASRLGHAERSGFPEAADRGSDFYMEVVKAAVEDWLMVHQRVRSYAGRFPEKVVFTRYEDLLADPARELGRLLDFLGVTSGEALLADLVARSSFEAFSGGRRPGEESKGSFYRKGVAGDWRNAVSERALALIVSGCGEAAAEQGYRLD
jgi:hypothetical protein